MDELHGPPDPLAGLSRPTIKDIQDATSLVAKVSLAELIGTGRSRYIVRPRQVAMYLSRRMTGNSLPQIARAFGHRDHTTVLWAHRQIEQFIRLDREVAELTLSVELAAKAIAAERLGQMRLDLLALHG